MANVDARWMVTDYTDDFNNDYENINFKYEETPNLPSPNSVLTGKFALRNGAINCTSNLFDMRKVRILWTNGTSTEIPIPTLAEVGQAIANARNLSNVACVSLIGERWSNVPATKLGKNFSDFASTAIAGAVKPPNQSVLFRYRLDGQGANNTNGPIVRKSFQTLPAVIYDAQVECIDALASNFNCSPTEGLELRHFIGKRAKTGGGSIARKVYIGIGTEAEIRICGGEIIDKFNCLSYKGTSIENTELFY